MRAVDGLKKCSKCGETKPVNQFNKHRRKIDGLALWCKPCMREYARRWYAQTPAPPKMRVVDGLKRCPKCGETKPVDQFHKNCKAVDGLTPRCKPCRREDYDRYVAEHPEYVEQNRANARRNAPRWRAEHPEKYAELHRRGNKTHMAKKRGNGGEMSWPQWTALVTAYGSKCLCCGARGTPDSLTMDHIIPVSKGGTSWPDNFQPLCGRCNSSKGANNTDYRPANWEILLDRALAACADS